MTNALIAAVQSMQNDSRHLEIISQNMVNVATPGYKRAIPTAQIFGDVLRMAEQDNIEASFGGHTPTLAHVLDLSPGSIKQTSRPWDVAILGDGFFEFATPDGPAYGRAGNFRLDRAGRLVSENGFAVQGVSGDIVLNGADATIDHLGRILQEGEIIGQIKVVRFTETKTLFKTGNGLLRPASMENIAITEQTPELQVGYLENSNVSSAREMVMMMETTRHFESAQKLFQGYDDMLGNAIRKLGEF